MKKKIVFTVLAVIVLFGGLCAYMAYDYNRRCVRITPRKDLPEVETGKTYGIEDFFLIENEKDTRRRAVGVVWEDGSSNHIVIEEDGHFTVLRGRGTLIISLTDQNSDSPEPTRASVQVSVRK